MATNTVHGKKETRIMLPIGKYKTIMHTQRCEEKEGGRKY